MRFIPSVIITNDSNEFMKKDKEYQRILMNIEYEKLGENHENRR